MNDDEEKTKKKKKKMIEQCWLLVVLQVPFSIKHKHTSALNLIIFLKKKIFKIILRENLNTEE